MAGQYIADLYNQMENEVVADIARRVRKTERFTETAEIQAKALRAQGYSPSKIQAEVMKRLNADNDYLQFVAENTRAYKQEVKELIKETVAQAVLDGDMLIGTAGEMAWNDDMQIWNDHGVDLKKDKTLAQYQKAFTEQTVGELKNFTRTTAMQVNGVPILDAYHHELDLAVLKVASGAFSFTQAMEDCCRRLGSSGVAVIYPSGRKYSLEAAARMTMKTGLSQLAGKITEYNLQKTETPLVYVSAHAGARPEHALWQGKVYTYSGKPTKDYPDFFDATDYGSVTGLKGVNCSHEFYPHWEGDPIPEFKEPDPVNIDGKDYTYYEATQEQRKMERQVRNMKREQAAAEAAGDQKKAAELEARIRATRQQYGQFSRQAGLRPKTERMGIFEENKTAQRKLKSGGSGIFEDIKNNKIEIIKPGKLSETLSEKDIIKKLGKNDPTDGSCTSQALAYLGNKAGFDVTDYRGGASKEYFQERENIKKLAQQPGVKFEIINSADDIMAALNLIKKIEPGKEYILATGGHTAIIRYNENLEFLELQKGKKGFKPLTFSKLERRFACINTNYEYTNPVYTDNILIDAETLMQTNGFKEALGYINTRRENA